MTETAEENRGRHASYVEYGKTLRAWFVAYGIGAPLLVLTQPSIKSAFLNSSLTWLICVLFLLGVVFQVWMALANKWSNWYRYEYMSSA